jgi:F-type H+-transporting ATPase subunit a
MHKHLHYILSILLLLCAINLQAAGSSEKGKPFDANKFIFGHIADAYDFHITTIGHQHVSVPLLVIVKGEENGWSVFPSYKVTHGDTYNGFYIQNEGAYSGKIVETLSNGDIHRPFDLSITKNVFSIFLSVFILIILFVPAANAYKRNPLGVPSKKNHLLEMVILAIQNDIVKPSVGKDYAKYSPYLLTAFFFILLNNLMGLIPFFPFGANVTGNIAVTMVLALFTYLITNIFGSREYWKEIFWPDVPVMLKFPLPLMPIIELISTFTKPFALLVRLFANIFAGHMIILVLMALIFIFGSIHPGAGFGVSIVSIGFSIFMFMLELLVAFIQAYVFTTLSAIFIGLSRVEPHHHIKKEVH